MTTVRTIATHEVVRALHPRPITEADERAIISGRLIDQALSRCGYEIALGRRPTTTALLESAAAEYDEAVADADLPEDEADRAATLAQVRAVLKAYRSSPIVGLERPRSRLVLVEGEVGLYTQPDFWDRSRRFYEMKSYALPPVPPDVLLQVRCFQLAFPGFESVLISFDRRRDPVPVALVPVPPMTSEESGPLLRDILRIGREVGLPKVLEFLGTPAAHYRIDTPAPAG